MKVRKTFFSPHNSIAKAATPGHLTPGVILTLKFVDMITHSISPTEKGRYRAEVVFQFGSRRHRLPRFCSDASRVFLEIALLKKRILLDELQKFVNHRKMVIVRLGLGLSTAGRIRAIDRIQQIIDISKGDKCPPALFALRVCRSAADLHCLVPGASSRYYENQTCFVTELLADCQTILKEHSHESVTN